MNNQIIKLTPVFKDYLWGGNSLQNLYDTNIYPLAEAWLLSANKNGETIVESGEYEGKTFSKYLEKIGEDKNFPLLIKFIDAEKNLSVQVHPNDEYANIYENGSFGKNEMWYILDCKDNAFIYYGLKETLSKEAFSQAIKDKTIENFLNKEYVKPGDTFYIEAGTIHAIGAGCTIAEIQQNSDITYRLYDYGREDKDGNERELHISKGTQVSNLEKINKNPPPTSSNITPKDETEYSITSLVHSKYFHVKRYDVLTNVSINPEQSFLSLVVIEGEGSLKNSLQNFEVFKGDSFYIPKNSEKFSVNGEISFIISEV